ncbi:MAG: hypothetical protein JEY91_02450 [Spirochaetaceae bacterium]|nr:hypothetical protein [Spirochaetaceae bacterium]
MIITRKEINRYNSIIGNIKKDNVLVDIHVHPFDLFTENMNYICRTKGIYSNCEEQYSPPFITAMDVNTSKQKQVMLKVFTSSELGNGKVFKSIDFTGSDVLKDYMKLCNLDRSVLLPVAIDDESNRKQMKMLNEMFGSNPMYYLGYSIPPEIPFDLIYKHLFKIMENQTITILKIHPGINKLDLSSREGLNHINAILSSSGKLKIPCIIHGGKTQNSDGSINDFSSIDHLSNIDWSITSEKVIIAHCGAFLSDLYQFDNSILPSLKKLLNRYSNLMVDTSGLDTDILDSLFRNIDSSRIIFGSDALYFSQWKTITKILYTLENLQMSIGDIFLEISSDNPLKKILKEK